MEARKTPFAERREGPLMRWAVVPGTRGQYKVSDTGKVFDLRRSRYVKLGTNNGYKVCPIRIRPGIWQSTGVHRLVHRAFNGRIPRVHHVNHKNGIRHDNRPSNLEAVTSQENNHDAFLRRWGRFKFRFKPTSVIKARKEWQWQPVVTTGLAARICGLGPVTFRRIAAKLKLRPIYISGGCSMYYPPDIEKLAKHLRPRLRKALAHVWHLRTALNYKGKAYKEGRP
jgi:hypothetical protein